MSQISKIFGFLRFSDFQTIRIINFRIFRRWNCHLVQQGGVGIPTSLYYAMLYYIVLYHHMLCYILRRWQCHPHLFRESHYAIGYSMFQRWRWHFHLFQGGGFGMPVMLRWHTILHNVCITVHITIECYTKLYYTILYYTIYYTILHYTILYTILYWYHTILYYTSMRDLENSVNLRNLRIWEIWAVWDLLDLKI